MKKSVLLIVAFLLLGIQLFAQKTIRITNGEWEPYLSQYSYKYGLASHIVSEAFKLENITIEWGFFPWKRSYVLAQKGVWDASAVWWPSPETKENFLVSSPVVKTSFVFFHLKNYKFQWKSMQDVHDQEIGFTRGYDYGKEFMSALKDKKINIQVSNSDELNFKKLLKGRIDIFPNDLLVGSSQIRNNFSDEEAKLFTSHPKQFSKNTLNLIICKHCENGQYFLEKFNSGLKKLIKSGRLKQMYKDLYSGKYDKQKMVWIE